MINNDELITDADTDSDAYFTSGERKRKWKQDVGQKSLWRMSLNAKCTGGPKILWGKLRILPKPKGSIQIAGIHWQRLLWAKNDDNARYDKMKANMFERVYNGATPFEQVNIKPETGLQIQRCLEIGDAKYLNLGKILHASDVNLPTTEDVYVLSFCIPVHGNTKRKLSQNTRNF